MGRDATTNSETQRGAVRRRCRENVAYFERQGPKTGLSWPDALCYPGLDRMRRLD
jgi:hypothetical protein